MNVHWNRYGLSLVILVIQTYCYFTSAAALQETLYPSTSYKKVTNSFRCFLRVITQEETLQLYSKQDSG
jgi:hypothetical protein